MSLNHKYQKLLNGTSDEFKRAYDDSKYFYENFNIISSSKLAVQHSLDYLITQDLYSRGYGGIGLPYLLQIFS